MRLQKSTTLRAGVAAIALTFAMIQTAVATEQDCPEGGVEGVRDGIGWSLSVDEASGSMVLTGSGADVAFVIFGACTPL